MIFRKYSTLVALFLILTAVSAQDQEAFFYGKLMDATTGEPVVFATIQIKDKALGVISNKDGGFKIPLDFQLKGAALIVSCMGYENKEIGFDEMRPNTIHQILLKPYVFALTETTVTARSNNRRALRIGAGKRLSAKQIVKRAIAQIPYNYDASSFELVGYYRDYQLRAQEYINLNEAIVKVFDKGFDIQDYSSLQFGLLDYTSNLDFTVDSLAAQPYNYLNREKYIPHVAFMNRIVPNELVLLFNHNAIRHHHELSYSFIDVFVEDFVKNHDFITFFETNYAAKRVYKIKFVKPLNRFQVDGTIYIDVDSYAIRKLEYAVYRKDSENPSSRSNHELEMDVLYEILVEYKEEGGLMYLNYISFNNGFKLVRPPKFYIKDVIRNYQNKELLLVLNQPAKNWYELTSKDFHLYYGEDRIKVDRISQMDVTTYKLELSQRGPSQIKRVWELFRAEGTDKELPIRLDIPDLMDFNDNLLGNGKSEILRQFREFFTQKVHLPRDSKIDTRSLVDKEVALGHAEQPKLKSSYKEEVWMNTPLKKMDP